MPKIRNIRKTMKARPTIEGAGVHLKRVFGNEQVPELDPFLLLDDFHSRNPEHYKRGFPWHPHRGIETITFVLEGRVEHADSMGNKGVIGSGDVQWMTAGSGIIHQEMPGGRPDGLLHGFQLWANLPASHKMMEPRYREVNRSAIPEVALDSGVRIKVISGLVSGVLGPVRDIVTKPEYLEVEVPENSFFTHQTEKGHTAFCYVISGKGFFGPKLDSQGRGLDRAEGSDPEKEPEISEESLVLFSDGDAVRVRTGGASVRFLLVSGKPIREPVAWSGPIVMNTQEELRIAFEEYENGTFLRRGEDLIRRKS